MSAPLVADSLTILTTFGPLATKRVRLGTDGAGTVEGYGNAKHYRAESWPVYGFASLTRRLDALFLASTSFLIRGEPMPGTPLARCRRLLHPDRETGEPATFADVPRRWLLLDFDTVKAPEGLDPMSGQAAALHLRSLLPGDFAEASFWWSYTSSAGFKPELRMRLAFWLDRPVTGAEVERWLADVPVDHSLFRAVQPNYVAAPVLVGVPDPVPQRAGIFHDADDTVTVPDIPAPAPKAAAAPAAPTHSVEGKRYVSGNDPATAEKRLAALCTAVERAETGGRHRCLMWAAARAVELDDAIPRHVIAAELAAAAKNAGLEDSDKELARQIKNGFALGVFDPDHATIGAAIAARLLKNSGFEVAA